MANMTKQVPMFTMPRKKNTTPKIRELSALEKEIIKEMGLTVETVPEYFWKYDSKGAKELDYDSFLQWAQARGPVQPSSSSSSSSSSGPDAMAL